MRRCILAASASLEIAPSRPGNMSAGGVDAVGDLTGEAERAWPCHGTDQAAVAVRPRAVGADIKAFQ